VSDFRATPAAGIRRRQSTDVNACKILRNANMPMLDNPPGIIEDRARVTRFLKAEAGAVVLWVIGSLVLAATLAPWIFQGGKWLGGLSGEGNLPAVLEWLGAAAARSSFDRFFNRSLLLSALLLLPLLLARLRRLRRQVEPWRSPTTTYPWKTRWLHFGVGFLVAAGLLWLLGSALEAAGAFQARPETPSFGKFLRKALLPAAGASLVEEWFFRGLLLGLWLKLAKPMAACIGTSVIFAAVHFVELPAGAVITNPAAADAGFRLLGLSALHFTDLRFFAGDFLTLFVVGLILGTARIRTGGLAFAIGLHAGWVFTLKGFHLLHHADPESRLSSWAVGNDLRSGLLPLATLAVTGAVCHFILPRLPGPTTLPPAKSPAESRLARP
jgi:membrane protease YdiL (CAAX protease family)